MSRRSGRFVVNGFAVNGAVAGDGTRRPVH